MVKKLFVGDDPREQHLPPLEAYTHIRGYHACRPVDIQDYYQYGIRAFSEETMQKNALSIFNKTLKEILDTDNCGENQQKKEVHFVVTKKLLLEDAGHYLCYGSEYLAGIAAHLDGGIIGPYHNRLLKTGIPTIFVCDVPIACLPEYLIEDFNENYNLQVSIDFGFWINQDLPSEYIVAHEHPTKMYDPLCCCYRTNKYACGE